MDYEKLKGRDEAGNFFTRRLLNDRATRIYVVVGQHVPVEGARNVILQRRKRHLGPPCEPLGLA